MKLLGILDKYIIETVICVLISYLFYYGIEDISIKIGQNICKEIDKNKRQKTPDIHQVNEQV